jgi:hypothetical protein
MGSHDGQDDYGPRGGLGTVIPPARPLADVEAIRFSAPLMITFLSVVILGEKVGPRRWLSLLERHPIYPAPSYSASWDTASFDVIQTGANAAL